MKLKIALFILLCLNATVLAWQWDAFARWGWGPNLHREPERLQQQIRPDALAFETEPARSSASAAATAQAPDLDASAALAPASDVASDPASAPVSRPASAPASAALAAPETPAAPGR